MNHELFINKLNNEFIKYDVTDCKVNKNALVVTIDKDKKFPEYKIVFTFENGDDASCFALFYIKDIDNIYELLNDYNNESFLKFSKEDDLLKISYQFYSLNDFDVLKVLQMITIMPTVIDEFSDDLLNIIK